MKFSEFMEHATQETLRRCEEEVNLRDIDVAVLRKGTTYYLCTDQDVIDRLFNHATNICKNCSLFLNGQCKKNQIGVLRLRQPVRAVFIRKGNTVYEPVLECHHFVACRDRTINNIERLKQLEKLADLYEIRQGYMHGFHLYGRKKGNGERY